jgi:hypothetical protein
MKINRDVFFRRDNYKEIEITTNNYNNYFTLSNIGEKYIDKLINNKRFGIFIMKYDKK